VRQNIFYRKGYKYQLIEDVSFRTDVYPPHDITTQFITLLANGFLTIRMGYAWDGPSGPTIDTRNFMRGSLAHDALYQLMNKPIERLTWNWKRAADYELYKICRQDGMCRRRANYVFKAVRKHGGKSGVTAHTLCSAPDKDAVKRIG